MMSVGRMFTSKISFEKQDNFGDESKQCVRVEWARHTDATS